MDDCKHLDTTGNLVPVPFGPGLCEEPMSECVHPDVTEAESEACALGTPCQHYEKDTYAEEDYYGKGNNMVEEPEKETRKILLPSGRTVSNEFFAQVVEAIVSAHASYGFDDWSEAIDATNQSLADDTWGNEQSFESEEDREAILEKVEPVARALSDVLNVVHGALFTSFVKNRDWSV